MEYRLLKSAFHSHLENINPASHDNSLSNYDKNMLICFVITKIFYEQLNSAVRLKWHFYTLWCRYLTQASILIVYFKNPNLHYGAIWLTYCWMVSI